MIETQLAQIVQHVSYLSRPQGHLAGQSEAGPKGHMKVITLRSGKQLDEPKATQGDESEDLVKDKGKELTKKEVNLVPEDREQASMEKSKAYGG